MGVLQECYGKGRRRATGVLRDFCGSATAELVEELRECYEAASGGLRDCYGIATEMWTDWYGSVTGVLRDSYGTSVELLQHSLGRIVCC